MILVVSQYPSFEGWVEALACPGGGGGGGVGC